VYVCVFFFCQYLLLFYLTVSLPSCFCGLNNTFCSYLNPRRRGKKYIIVIYRFLFNVVYRYDYRGTRCVVFVYIFVYIFRRKSNPRPVDLNFDWRRKSKRICLTTGLVALGIAKYCRVLINTGAKVIFFGRGSDLLKLYIPLTSST